MWLPFLSPLLFRSPDGQRTRYTSANDDDDDDDDDDDGSMECWQIRIANSYEEPTLLHLQHYYAVRPADSRQ